MVSSIRYDPLSAGHFSFNLHRCVVITPHPLPSDTRLLVGLQGVLRQLANFTKQQEGVFDLGSARRRVATNTEDDDEQTGRVEKDGEKDGDAIDFMDEVELIEDEGGLDEMMEAELEDYDEDEGGQPVYQPVLQPRVKITRENQAEEALKNGIMLPVLGMSEEGESLLDFSHLFRSTLVMADADIRERGRAGRRRRPAAGD